MKLLIGSLIALALIVIVLLCIIGVYFIILMIENIKEVIEELKED